MSKEQRVVNIVGSLIRTLDAEIQKTMHSLEISDLDKYTIHWNVLSNLVAFFFHSRVLRYGIDPYPETEDLLNNFLQAIKKVLENICPINP